MVHALEESGRVLARNGRIIDIRPVTSYPPIEVITGDGTRLAGRADDSLGLPDDQAANHAVAEALRQGVFFKETEAQFQFMYYWDTLAQMQAYVEERLSDWIILGKTTLQNVSRLLSESSGQVQLRLSLEVLISVYRKPG